MSREIDTSKGLGKVSKEDLEYLRDRGRLTPDQEREFLGGIQNTAPTAPNVSEMQNTGDINAEAPPAVESLRPDEDDEESVEVEPLTAPYSGYTNDLLEQEIKRRNINRPDDEQIAPDGTTKQDLVDALEEDDDINEGQ